MLIVCPECGGKVSDQAEQCIHCGFPLSKIADKGNHRCNVDGVEYDLYFLVEKVKELKDKKRDYGTMWAVICTLLDHTVKNPSRDYNDLVTLIVNEERIPKTFTSKPNEEPKIRCPRCNSTQITTGPRGVSGFWGFIGASKTVNRCSNCGETWEP